MLRRAVIVVVACLSSLLPSARSQTPCPVYPLPVPIPNISSNPTLASALHDADVLLSEIFNSSNIPGFFAVIVYDQEIIWSNGYGDRNVFSPSAVPPGLDDIIAVESITKLFTSLMMFKLRDMGQVALDDPVAQYLTDFDPPSQYPSRRPISLRALAGHVAGLSRETPFCVPNNVSAVACSEEEFLAIINTMELTVMPFTTPLYSNLGFDLLGHALEKAVGSNYSSYVEAQLLAPIGMTSSTFNFSAIDPARLAHAAVQNKSGQFIPVPVTPIDNPPWSAPSGGLFSTARDMASFMSWVFNESNDQLDPSTTYEWLFHTFSSLPDPLSMFGTPTEFYYQQDYWVSAKDGSGLGYSTEVAMVPEVKLGVFTFALGPVGSSPDDPQQTLQTGPILSLVMPALRFVLWSLQPAYEPPPAVVVSQVVGTYALIGPILPWAPVLAIMVTMQSDVLVAIPLFEGSPAAPPLNMTFSPPLPDLPLQYSFRVHAPPGLMSCKSLADSATEEFAVFQLPSVGAHATTARYVGALYKWDRQSK